MSGFGPTYKRLQTIHERMPDFPVEPMRLMRMTFHLQKALKDAANAALKKHELVDANWMVLSVLYGSEDESSTASNLGEACLEKPANLTRVCDDLDARGLIKRGVRAGDRRCVMISLTDSGRALIERAMPDVTQHIARAYQDFTSTEMAKMEKMGERLLTNLLSLD